MSLYLGVDVGTTKIAVVALDVESGRTVAQCETPNDSEITSAAGKALGRSEWDADRAADLTLSCISEAVAKTGGRRIECVGVAGQMHGVLLLGAGGKPAGPFIGWQDQRGQESSPNGGGSYIGLMMRQAGLGGFAHTGCTPATGYMGSTLFWMAVNRDPRVRADGPGAGVKACFLADYIVLRLTGQGPVTDPTNAGGSGIFDVINGQWNKMLIDRLGLRMDLFPPVRKSGETAGTVTAEAAAATGLAAETPVCVGCGDNQAGFAGSVAEASSMLLANIGTGAQVSAWTPRPLIVPSVDTRPHLDGGFLLVGAPLCGGLSYALLRDFFRMVGREFFDARGDEDLYDQTNQLAAAVPQGADGLRCEPLFTGTRLDPSRRATWTGMSQANFTPGHFARAILEGVADELRKYYTGMLEGGVKLHSRLVCAGNGVRRNPLLGTIVGHAFQMPVQVTASTEEAAVGAALLAATGSGRFASLAEACKLVQYR